MSVEVYNNGRSREVKGSLYIERWVQMNAGIGTVGAGIIYGPTGDLNRIDALSDSLTAASPGRMWFKGSSPGESDNGESNSAWFGLAIRVPFTRTQTTQQWHTLEAELRAFVEAAFPNELIQEAGRELDRPELQTPEDPAKYVLWMIEYD